MSIRSSIGITSYRRADLAPSDLEQLALWRDLDAVEPYFLDLNHIDELASYLLDCAEPGNDKRYAPIRRALLNSARIFRTRNGRELAVLSETTESSIRRRIAAFGKQYQKDVRSLNHPITKAGACILKNGAVAGSLHDALRIWSEVADSLESFLSVPRRSRRFGIDDFLRRGDVDGLRALVGILELYRLLLLASGHALSTLGAAAIGNYDFVNMEFAVDVWRISQGDAVRRIGEALLELAKRTDGFDAPESLPEPALGDESWIIPYSHLGQRAAEWIMDHNDRLLNYTTLDVVWPSPASYGYDDGAGRPCAACGLLEGLSCRQGDLDDVLFGSDSVTISDDLTIMMPARLLKGDRSVYVAKHVDERGDHLCCVGESHRIKLLSKLIADEQGLKGHAWGFVGNGERTDVPDGFSDDFDKWFALLSVEGSIIELDEQRRMPLGDTGFDNLGPGNRLVISGEGETFRISLENQEGEASTLENGKLADIYYGDLQ